MKNLLKPVRTSNTPEAVVAQVTQLIRDGSLKPGDKLPTETELVAQLGIGRSSLREAKRVLVAKGIIESQPGRGTFVRELGPEVVDGQLLQALLARETLLDLQEVRDLLEDHIISLAIQRATDEDLETIELWLKRMEDGAAGSQIYDLSIEFHRSIVAATHNRVLIQLYDVVSGLLLEYQRPLYARHGDAEAEIQEHQVLFEAIRRRDLERARALMAEHMEKARDFVSEFTHGPRRPKP